MLATSQIVILLFSRTSSFTQPTFLFVLLVGGSPKHLASSAEIILLLNLRDLKKKLASFHCLPSKCHFLHFECFCSIFLSLFMVNFYGDKWFFEVCHFLGIPESKMEQNPRTLKKTLLNNHTYYRIVLSRK
jgi:hypothetical protein